ncbi:MAG: agmatinase [Candidatus Micrarchaeota archaeon]|nr:agmatinase [Candidatus Micrarchaeota archaeon]
MNFASTMGDFASFKKSYFSIIPFSYEMTTSYMKGTSKGPESLIDASQNLELFDEQFNVNAAEKGIFTFANTEEKGIAQANLGKSLDSKKFPIVLGGEHSITPMMFETAANKFGKMNYIVFDAHADLKDSYLGNKMSHACATRRVYDISKSVALFGIRSIDDSESEFISKNKIPVYYPYKQNIKEALKIAGSLDPKLPTYVSFDVDGLDPSIMPGTGTPEPGGLTWYEAISILETIFKRYNVVAADCVELMPLKSSIVSDFTASKLIYKLMAMKISCKKQD